MQMFKPSKIDHKGWKPVHPVTETAVSPQVKAWRLDGAELHLGSVVEEGSLVLGVLGEYMVSLSDSRWVRISHTVDGTQAAEFLLEKSARTPVNSVTSPKRRKVFVASEDGFLYQVCFTNVLLSEPTDKLGKIPPEHLKLTCSRLRTLRNTSESIQFLSRITILLRKKINIFVKEVTIFQKVTNEEKCDFKKKCSHEKSCSSKEQKRNFQYLIIHSRYNIIFCGKQKNIWKKVF